MGLDIEETKSRCSICAKYKPANPYEPLIPHVILKRPWSKLGIDIFTFRGRDYLLVVDYFFRYPDVYQLSTKTASRVISHLKTCFETHGKPDTAIADNMPFGAMSLLSLPKSGASKLRHQVLTRPHPMGKVRDQLEQ